jgi:hypothetical protein
MATIGASVLRWLLEDSNWQTLTLNGEAIKLIKVVGHGMQQQDTRTILQLETTLSIQAVKNLIETTPTITIRPGGEDVITAPVRDNAFTIAFEKSSTAMSFYMYHRRTLNVGFYQPPLDPPPTKRLNRSERRQYHKINKDRRHFRTNAEWRAHLQHIKDKQRSSPSLLLTQPTLMDSIAGANMAPPDTSDTIGRDFDTSSDDGGSISVTMSLPDSSTPSPDPAPFAHASLSKALVDPWKTTSTWRSSQPCNFPPELGLTPDEISDRSSA